jgi:hypothetical protein
MKRSSLVSSLGKSFGAVATLLLLSSSMVFAQPAPSSQAHPPVILVELFTSEGCSSCPPADELLRQFSGRHTAAGQLIVALSEHVSYWNDLGWHDPFSAEQYTQRQNEYGTHFNLDSVYTPQMVVNGREQFVGSDRRALEAAFASETQHAQIALTLQSAHIAEGKVTFSYTAAGLPQGKALQLMAALVDDLDHSSVLRGENSGRQLTHVFVARALASVGPLAATPGKTFTLPLPPSFATSPGTGHHLILFAQSEGTGPIEGIAVLPL